MWNVYKSLADWEVDQGDFDKAIDFYQRASANHSQYEGERLPSHYPEQEENSQIQLEIIEKLSKLLLDRKHPRDIEEARILCETELEELKFMNFAHEMPCSCEDCINGIQFYKRRRFDPLTRIAQCWRIEGNFDNAIKSIDDSLTIDKNYKHIFKGICNYHKTKNVDFLDTEFAKVIETFGTFNDVKQILNKNKEAFEIFPEDRFLLIDRILPFLKRRLKKSISMDFIRQIENLKNSLRVTYYLKTKLKL